jgi:hypothetical protein
MVSAAEGEEMSIIEQAKAELDVVNFGEDDTKVMLEILRKFFDQWDSGGAVSVAVPVLMRLLGGMPLSPLTGRDEEWHEVGHGVWQNIRRSTVFKQLEPQPRWGRGGLHPYDIENLDWDGNFPYNPPTSLPPEPLMEIET